MFVCGIVVDVQMQVESRRRLGVDLLQELDPFLMSVLRQAVRNDFAVGKCNGIE
jgi:hypothetical protein